MDVERVQKINNLALELMKQGLVQEREEAVKQAEGILAKKDCSSLNEEVKELNLDKEEGKMEEELGKEKVREILEKNTTFIVQKMRENQKQMGEFKEEINKLRSEITVLRGSMSNLKTKQESFALKEVAKEEPQQKLEAKESKSPVEDHPRSGSYSDVDVSIEKFFYSGSKSKD